MGKPERQLRLFQGGCILFLVVCIFLMYFGVLGSLEPDGRRMNFIQFLVIVGAIWSAVVGFTFHRRMTRSTTRLQRPTAKSTPFTRWRAGHVMRLGSATSVGMWGLVLYYYRAPMWVVDAVLAVGLILLVMWRPGDSPDSKITNQPSVQG
jgi:multisubunit Na+/H+ antiporter MnhB subunit